MQSSSFCVACPWPETGNDKEASDSTNQHKSLITALHLKYQPVELDDEIVCKIYVFPGGPHKTDTGKLVIPEVLIMDHCGITHAGDQDEIADLCGSVREMDLAENCITDAAELLLTRNCLRVFDNAIKPDCLALRRMILKIISQMPGLTFLNISSNDFSSFSPRDYSCQYYFRNVTKLAMNKTRASWDAIWWLIDMMPNIEELYLCLNELSVVDARNDMTSPQLELLSFNGNKITDWSEICKLGKLFPNLKTLLVSENPISAITSAEETVQIFKHLQTLNISKTRLSSWKDVEIISTFPSLIDVHLTGVPLFENLTDMQKWQLPVAHLPRVTVFNRSVIIDEERETCERAFIRYYMECDVKPSRYYELEEKHGKLNPLAKINLAPPDTATVILKFQDQERLSEVQLRQTVWDFKRRMSRWVCLHPSKMRVHCLETDMAQVRGHEELKNNRKHLYAYRVRDGHELLIEPK